MTVDAYALLRRVDSTRWSRGECWGHVSAYLSRTIHMDLELDEKAATIMAQRCS